MGHFSRKQEGSYWCLHINKTQIKNDKYANIQYQADEHNERFNPQRWKANPQTP